MARHNRLGQKGETLAAAFLEREGYSILHRNWRHGRYELDLIAWKEGVLHFVEVKLRTSRQFGYPEEAVTPKKFACLLEAADEFLHQHQTYRHVQYDILAIRLLRGKEEYFLVEDVYY